MIQEREKWMSKIENKIVNPMGNDQTFKAYQKRGYEFNILMGYSDSIRPWLLGKYCNCLAGKNEHSKFDFVIYGGEWFSDEDVFITDVIRARKDLCLAFQNNLFKIITDRLKIGSYIYGYFDEYYVKSKKAYNKFHYRHSFLVYGYEDDAKLFYAIGYTNKSKFEKYTISYDDFMTALTSLNQIDLTFVSVNPKFNFTISIESIYRELYDYIHSTCSDGSYERKVIYGIDTHTELLSYVQQTVDIKKDLDYRYSRFFMEFKNFMLERLSFLGENAYIRDCYKEYSDICQMFQNIHLLFIKYNMTKDFSISQRICEIIQESIVRERTILSSALSDLRKTLIENNNRNYI